ncbi:MAG: hypothetical protein ACKE51_00110 [Methylococcaceae bacterium]
MKAIHGGNLKAHTTNTTSQYNLPPIKINLKNKEARKHVKSAFPDPIVQKNMDLNTALLECYAELTGSEVERNGV